MTLVLLSIAIVAGCDKKPPAKPATVEPAHVDHHVDENKLNTITLSEKAVDRLGIVVIAAKLKDVRRQRMVSGEVIIPPGKVAVVSAPMAGTLIQPESVKPPQAGQTLTKNQVVYLFEPLLTPERDVLTPSERVNLAQTRATVATAQIDALRQVESAKVTLDAAQIAFDRSKALLASRAGSQRTVDEMQAGLRLAQEALKTAQARNKFLATINLDEETPGNVERRPITSPTAGVLQTLDSPAGETVAAGERLFTVMTTTDVWIRVPVYAGRLRDIDQELPARVVEFGAAVKSTPQDAMIVSAPPSANPVAATVDVFYALENASGRLHPGQRLSVTLPLTSSRQSLVIPFKAVVYDIHGGAWVYRQLEPAVFARQRVSIEFVDGKNAVVAAGLKAGIHVVTDGAVELFGTEFGVGH